MTPLPNTNKQWRLASYPEGMPSEATWTLSEGPMPQPGADQMLARAIYLDVAPYMRSRISPQKNYAAGNEQPRGKPRGIKTKDNGKVRAPRGGELDPERLNPAMS